MLLQNTKNTPSFTPTSVLYNGLRASTHWLYSTTWVDFRLVIALKVQLMLLIYFVCIHKNVNYIF